MKKGKENYEMENQHPCKKKGKNIFFPSEKIRTRTAFSANSLVSYSTNACNCIKIIRISETQSIFINKGDK